MFFFSKRRRNLLAYAFFRKGRIAREERKGEVWGGGRRESVCVRKRDREEGGRESEREERGSKAGLVVGKGRQ